MFPSYFTFHLHWWKMFKITGLMITIHDNVKIFAQKQSLQQCVLVLSIKSKDDWWIWIISDQFEANHQKSVETAGKISCWIRILIKD